MIPNDLIQWLRPVGKERLFFFISHILYNIVLFIVAIIAAKIAGPEKWGLITLLMLVATYSGFLTLGINNGMGITLPLAIGKNDDSNILKIKSTVFTALFITLIPIGISQFILIYYWQKPLIDWVILFGFTLSFQLLTYFKIQLRSYENFKLFTLAYFVQIISLSIGLLGLIQGCHYLVIVGLGNLIAGLFIWLKINVKPSFQIHKKSLIQILKIGLPVMTAGIVGELLLSVDRILISIFLEDIQLGYYGFSSNFFKGVRIIGVAVSIITLPRIVKSFAKQDYQQMLRYSVIQQWSSLGLMGIASIITAISLYYLVPIFMPEFESSLRVSYILLGVATLIPLGFYPHILNTIGKQKVYLITQIFGIGLNVIISTSFIYLGYGIDGVALGSLISMVAYVILIRYLGSNAVHHLING